MLSLLLLAAADIPVHCLIADFAGPWQLMLGDPVKADATAADVPDFDRGGIASDYCYSGHPNNNHDNVALDLQARMAADNVNLRQVNMTLTEEISVRNDESEHLVAVVNGGNATWTTAYDEGWELRAGPELRLFALAKYKCASAEGCGKNGVGEDSWGQTDGYESLCGQTLVGWYHTPMGRGCFYGHKVDVKQAAQVHALVLLEQGSAGVPVHTAYHHASTPSLALPSVLELHRAGGSRAFRATRRAAHIRMTRARGDEMRVRDQCEGDDIAMADEIEAMEAKDPVFDWRDQFGGAWNTKVLDQGGCGSCYAIAMSYALQSRGNILRLKEMQKRGLASTISRANAPAAAKLSPASVLSCSYYNQGCDGGYPYLVAKHAADFGIPAEECQPYNSASQQGHPDACDAGCYQDESKVMFAKNYNYVGGFYGVCGQARMMKSLREDGPLAVAIDVPEPFQTADEDHVAGDVEVRSDVAKMSQEQNLRDSETAEPKSHHRKDPAATVRMLEAKWRLLETMPHCGREHGSMSADSPVVTSALKVAFEKAFVARTPGRFALDSDRLPKGSDPRKMAQEAVAKTLLVPADCVHMTLVDGTMNGWEYTNHAITLVGWGQNEVEREDGSKYTQKYWIIRNSWGEYFGNDGYAYVLRGANYGGLESQAVAVDVDTDRGMVAAWLKDMPTGLAEVRKHVAVDARGELSEQ